MRMHPRLLAAASTVLALGAWFLAPPGRSASADNDMLWKPFLSADWLTKLVEDENKIIQDELAKGKPDDKKIRGSAIVIALAAQNGMKDNADVKILATLRDTAMKLARAADKKNTAEAKKQAEVIAKFKDLKADDQADPKPLDLNKQIEDLGDAMKVFALPTKGGEGIEKEFLSLGGQRKMLTTAQMSDKLVLMAYKSALVAEVSRAHVAVAKNKKKDWLQWTDDMRKYSLEVAEAVQGKKAKEVKFALEKANASCNACHKVFKD